MATTAAGGGGGGGGGTTQEAIGDSGNAQGTSTTAQPGLIAASGSGEFMGTVGIIGGASIVFLGLVLICCRWLIKFTSVEQREIRRKAEVEALQREQERLQKALLEMNSTEAATQRRADRERQKLVEKVNKQEEIRIRNERAKNKRLKELAYELKKQGTGIVIDGLEDSSDDDVPGVGEVAAATAAAAAADEKKGNSGSNNKDAKKPGAAAEVVHVSEEKQKQRLDRQRAQEDKQERLRGHFNPEPLDPDEGEPFVAVPPPLYKNDANFFKHATVDEAARAGRLVPSAEQSRYHKPWDPKEAPKQKFVPGLSVRRVIPTDSEECAKVPVVVYDEEKDDFVYISHEEHQRRQAEERARTAANVMAREKEERDRAKKGGVAAAAAVAMDFDEVDSGAAAASSEARGRRMAELPPIAEPWTANTLELPLARAHNGVRASTEVKLQKARFIVEELE
jgi:hypothetical protein